MNKERINEIIKLSKQESSTVKKVFDCLDEVSKFLVEDKKFFTFVEGKAKNNYISPTEMFVLCYDYLNKTGKYAEYLENKKVSKKSEKKAKAKTKEVKKVEKKFDIFDLNL